MEHEGPELLYLREAADHVRSQHVGDEVHLRAIIEFSNVCTRSCYYCGLRRQNQTVPRYTMQEEELLDQAGFAAELGYRTVVLQSGEDPGLVAEDLARVVQRVTAGLGLVVTLSVGERQRSDYASWYRAGARRYLLKHETADPGLYRSLHPDAGWDRRRQCLLWLKELGYQVGSGCMVGLPGQTTAMLADDLLFMQELDVEMAGIGPFIPSPNTPLAGEPVGSAAMTWKMVALARLLLPQAHLPGTTATRVRERDGHLEALRWGANVLMLNLTPPPYQDWYQIYPGRRQHVDPRTQRELVVERLQKMGRRAGSGPGHSVKKATW